MARKTPARENTTIPWIAPQLATLTDEAPAGDDWLHEIKYDGYRILAQLTPSGVRLLTRNRKDWTDRFQAVAAALARLKLAPALLDGEVAVEVEGGSTSFQALQNALNEPARGALQFFVFDALVLGGEPLTKLPLTERKAMLQKALRGAPSIIRYSDHVLGNGDAFFAQACAHGLEGIISKRASAPYRPGRGYDWLKVKCVREQEFVIGGYTAPGGSRQGFGALHVGAYDDAGRLVYRGKVGTGFTDATLQQLERRLSALRRQDSPFALGTPRGAAARGTVWIEPKLVAQIRFTEVTSDGRLRHPSFAGLREDKDASAVTLETAVSRKTVNRKTVNRKTAIRKTAIRKTAIRKTAIRKTAIRKSAVRDGAARKTAKTVKTAKTAKTAKIAKTAPPPASRGLRPKPSGGTRNPADAGTRGAPAKQSKASVGAPVVFAGVRLSSPNKVLYPDQGVTKLDLARYYETVAEWMLPHIKDRPLTLVRCPTGHTGWCFFQKHMDEGEPKELGRVQVEEKDGPEWYGYVHSLQGLIALAQMGALELHASNARRQNLEKPDRFVIDLDPDEELPWKEIAEAARNVRDLLAELGLRSFVKTTGGKGLHVAVPIQRRSDWDEVKAFSGAVAEVLARAAPTRYTTDIAKKKRKGRILLDYLRNARGQTAIEAYSTRARPGAPVSAPLHWEELDRGAHPDDFTVQSMPQRVARLKQDPWKEFGAVKQSLTAPMKRRLGL